MRNTKHNLWSRSLGIFLNTGCLWFDSPTIQVSQWPQELLFSPFSLFRLELSWLAFFHFLLHLHFPRIWPEFLVLVAELVVGLEVGATNCYSSNWFPGQWPEPVLLCFPLPWILCGMHRIARISIVLQNVNKIQFLPYLKTLTSSYVLMSKMTKLATWYFITLFDFPLLLTLIFVRKSQRET